MSRVLGKAICTSISIFDGDHTAEYTGYCLKAHDVVSSRTKVQTFQRSVLIPASE
jgi:hypothetical protein